MVSNPITNSLQKFAAQNIAHGIKENLPLNRAHFSGPSGGYQQHVYHEYDGGHGQGHGHSHSSHGGGKKRSIALSALTLLAFLYFLNILQNCLEEQMEQATAAPQVIVMASRLHQHFREEELPQETSKSGSSESGSIEEKQEIDKNISEQDNFQRIDNYFNSTLNHYKKHKKGKL